MASEIFMPRTPRDIASMLGIAAVSPWREILIKRLRSMDQRIALPHIVSKCGVEITDDTFHFESAEGQVFVLMSRIHHDRLGHPGVVSLLKRRNLTEIQLDRVWGCGNNSGIPISGADLIGLGYSHTIYGPPSELVALTGQPGKQIIETFTYKADMNGDRFMMEVTSPLKNIIERGDIVC